MNAAMKMDKIRGKQTECNFSINEGHCAFTLIFQTPGYKNKINYNYKHKNTEVHTKNSSTTCQNC
jgi:hypothetical protein